MYANAAIQFRDPFAARDSSINREPHSWGQSRANWASYTSNQNLNRALTPPPDMNNVSHASQHVSRQEHGQHHYSSHMPARSTYRAPVAQNSHYAASGHDRAVDSGRSAKVSPGVQSRLPAIETANDAQSRSQKPNDSLIAPSFQIPSSVNDSGGSLSELAAEVSWEFGVLRKKAEQFTDNMLDHMSILVRIIGSARRNRKLANHAPAAQEIMQRCNSNYWLPQMGHYDTVNNTRRPERGPPGSAICVPFEEAQPGGQGQTW
jgi:hypothetical protein